MGAGLIRGASGITGPPRATAGFVTGQSGSELRPSADAGVGWSQSRTRQATGAALSSPD